MKFIWKHIEKTQLFCIPTMDILFKEAPHNIFSNRNKYIIFKKILFKDARKSNTDIEYSLQCLYFHKGILLKQVQT